MKPFHELRILFERRDDKVFVLVLKKKKKGSNSLVNSGYRKNYEFNAIFTNILVQTSKRSGFFKNPLYTEQKSSKVNKLDIQNFYIKFIQRSQHIFCFIV